MSPDETQFAATVKALSAGSARSARRHTVANNPFPVLVNLLLAMGIAALLGIAPATGAEQNRLPPIPPAAAPPGVRVLRDLEYVPGGHERNRLDLYLPEKAAGPRPVIVWVHGGGWTNGDKTRD